MNVIGSDGVMKQSLSFPNLITNNGMDILGGSSTPSSFIHRCSVGTGTALPAFTNTSLETLIASSTTNTKTYVNSGAAPWYQAVRAKFTFPSGTFNGQSLSEVGVFNTSGVMFSRSLIKDSAGNTTKVVVLDNESLEIVYELVKWVVGVDSVQSYQYSSSSGTSTQTATIRASDGNTSSTTGYWYPDFPITGFTKATAFNTSTLGSILSRPGSTEQGDGSITWNSYVAGTFERSATVVFSTSQANLTSPIGCVAVGGSGGYGFQISFSSPFPKNNASIIKIPFKVVWSRR